MYRPNRIGPWPLAAIDSGEVDFGILAAASAEGTFEPYVPDAVIRDKTASRQFTARTVATMGVGTRTSVGVAVNGANPVVDDGLAMSTGFLVCVSGHMNYEVQAGSGPVHVFAAVGRSDDATLDAFGTDDNPCANYWYCPAHVFNIDADHGGISLNTAIAVGNWDGAVTPSSNPLIFGFGVVNRSAGNMQVRMYGSMHVHKYSSDLDLFDPTRQ